MFFFEQSCTSKAVIAYNHAAKFHTNTSKPISATAFSSKPFKSKWLLSFAGSFEGGLAVFSHTKILVLRLQTSGNRLTKGASYVGQHCYRPTLFLVPEANLTLFVIVMLHHIVKILIIPFIIWMSTKCIDIQLSTCILLTNFNQKFHISYGFASMFQKRQIMECFWVRLHTVQTE